MFLDDDSTVGLMGVGLRLLKVGLHEIVGIQNILSTKQGGVLRNWRVCSPASWNLCAASRRWGCVSVLQLL